MTGWDPTAVDLLEILARTVRGPRREGVYALWLLLRVAGDYLLEPPLAERATRRRVAALEARLSSLTVPPPLRRALTAALHQLKQEALESVPLVLGSLVAPARETTGPDAADAVQRAARAARHALQTASR
jgi:hypothetical protein